MVQAEIKSPWGVYEVYHDENCDPNIITQIVNTSKFPIYRLSAYKTDNLVSITSKAETRTIKELRNALYKFTDTVT